MLLDELAKRLLQRRRLVSLCDSERAFLTSRCRCSCWWKRRRHVEICRLLKSRQLDEGVLPQVASQTLPVKPCFEFRGATFAFNFELEDLSYAALWAPISSCKLNPCF